MKKIEFFKVEGDKINRVRKHCPKCGPGVFIAEHKDRFSCGKCGYTEFKSGGRKEQPTVVSQEKPVEKPPKEEKPAEPVTPAEPAKETSTEETVVEESKPEEKIEDKKE